MLLFYFAEAMKIRAISRRLFVQITLIVHHSSNEFVDLSYGDASL